MLLKCNERHTVCEPGPWTPREGPKEGKYTQEGHEGLGPVRGYHYRAWEREKKMK